MVTRVRDLFVSHGYNRVVPHGRPEHVIHLFQQRNINTRLLGYFGVVELPNMVRKRCMMLKFPPVFCQKNALVLRVLAR